MEIASVADLAWFGTEKDCRGERGAELDGRVGRRAAGLVLSRTRTAEGYTGVDVNALESIAHLRGGW